MRNYIKAELYRNLNRVYFWGFTATLAVAALGATLIIWYTNKNFNSNITFGMLFEIGITMLIVPMYISIAFTEMVSSEEHKHLTLKNVIAAGLSRTKMYIGKIITSIILAVLSASIILVVFFGSGALLLGNTGSVEGWMIENFIIRMGAALPLWIASIALSMLISFIITAPTAFALTYVGIITLLPTALQLLGVFVSNIFNRIADLTFMAQLHVVAGQYDTMFSNWSEPVFLGLIQTLILVIIGIVVSKKMTIK